MADIRKIRDVNERSLPNEKNGPSRSDKFSKMQEVFL